MTIRVNDRGTFNIPKQSFLLIASFPCEKAITAPSKASYLHHNPVTLAKLMNDWNVRMNDTGRVAQIANQWRGARRKFVSSPKLPWWCLREVHLYQRDEIKEKIPSKVQIKLAFCTFGFARLVSLTNRKVMPTEAHPNAVIQIKITTSEHLNETI